MSGVLRKLLFAFAALIITAPALAQQRVVLIAAADSPIDTMTTFEVRKVYLGLDVEKQGGYVRPLRNTSNPELEEIFLQAIIGLTRDGYERRLLNNLLRLGAVRPEEFPDPETLNAELSEDEYAVTFAFDDGDLTGVKVLRVLWQE